MNDFINTIKIDSTEHLFNNEVFKKKISHESDFFEEKNIFGVLD